ncbi:MAG: ATP-binding protein [Lachnospiraceae bacterium]
MDKKKTQDKQQLQVNIFKWIFSIFITAVFIYFVLGQLLLPRELADNSKCEAFDVTWTMIREDGSASEVRLPGKFDVNRNERVTFVTTIPEDTEENMYICFRSNRQDFEIYVDDVLRKEYSTEDSRLFGKASVGAFVFLELHSDDAGRKLTLVAQTDSSYSGSYREIFYGDRLGIWKSIFKKNSAEFITALLMFTLSVISVIGSIIIRNCFKKQFDLEYLSWGVLLASIWILANSRIRQLIFPNVSVVNDIAFFMVMLLPFPFMIYINNIQKNRYFKAYAVNAVLAVLDVVVCTTLQVLDIVDFSDSIVIIAMFCGLFIVTVASTMIIDCFKGYIKSYRLQAIGILGASIAALIQFGFYFSRNRSFDGSMLALGLIFLLVDSVVCTVYEVLKLDREKQKAVFESQAKARFLANMSHEIRTPINAILGMDELILRESTQQDITEYASDIKIAGQSLLSLINDILDFSKIESGKMDIIPVDYQLSKLIKSCYNMMSFRAKDKNLEFVVECDENLPENINGDESRIRQIIINLLSNAVKYTKEGKVIFSVSGERKEDKVLLLKISVKDTGIGITKEDQNKLFDSFQRLDMKKNRKVEGTGLGLAITRQLVELMNGTISVESEYLKGSTFEVIIPQVIVSDDVIGDISKKQSRADSEESKPAAPDKELKVSNNKVLVVDDVKMNLKVFVGLLKNSGLEIDTAESGMECLELVKKKKYDIIFMDHMMPEMDGIETFHAMKNMDDNMNPDTPVIMLTANAIEGVKEEYIKEGFDDYISKPIQKNYLEDMIKKYLG